MRTAALIVGVLLLVAGGLISAGILSFDKEETVAKLGPLEIVTTDHKKPAPVVGYLLLGVGALVLVVGLVGRK
ncbi:hypothetical protein [Methylibium sp.]|uniref:hypothetical protein n=1 Tax=Methylibium sp. TaxID=2067992 RepID=UPI003BA98769